MAAVMPSVCPCQELTVEVMMTPFGRSCLATNRYDIPVVTEGAFEALLAQVAT